MADDVIPTRVGVEKGKSRRLHAVGMMHTLGFPTNPVPRLLFPPRSFAARADYVDSHGLGIIVNCLFLLACYPVTQCLHLRIGRVVSKAIQHGLRACPASQSIGTILSIPVFIPTHAMHASVAPLQTEPRYLIVHNAAS